MSYSKEDLQSYLKVQSGDENKLEWDQDFILDPTNLKDFDQTNLPRFLFRIFSPKSRGRNTTTQFVAHRFLDHNDSFAPPNISVCEASQLSSDIHKHLTFKQFDSPFVTLTGSLAHTLAWAYRLRTRATHRVHGLQLAVIDTSKLDGGLIFPAEFLRSLVAQEKNERNHVKYNTYRDEFLAFGTLHGDFLMSSLETNILVRIAACLPEAVRLKNEPWGFEQDEIDRAMQDASQMSVMSEYEMVRFAQTLSKPISFFPMAVHVVLMRAHASGFEESMASGIFSACGKEV